ncbi:receptor protein kinase-like protein ZAR1 [Beta vulgaris subsp. vulgaris]|uniref:receptor protein kinase-like protein ZAR1 n=1 Tax=Beta vulgaris subsp. vulgaris TaxID=3555 RepID=UPI00203737F5|nr:receptor protein kinase-like protein ZAR1 [Beta vulgaris subsp. vulgaris]
MKQTTTFIFVLIINLSFSLSSFSLNSDGLSLLALKSAITSDPTRSLSTWVDSDSNPCHWVNIRCTNNRVTDISLSNKTLTGYLPSELGAILSLRRLSLSYNNFSTTISPHLFNATSLTFLDLSHNSLSGPIPAQISSLVGLKFLDLSSNFLNGSLPSGLSELTQLEGTLNLSYNQFSGEVPASFGRFPVMVSLDLRHNNLSGKIPQVGSLLNQGPTAFAGNPNLCGFPLSSTCPEAQNPNLLPGNPENPDDPTTPNLGSGESAERGRRRTVSISLILAILAVLACGGILVFLYVMRKNLRGSKKRDNNNKNNEEKVGKEEVVSHVRVVVGDEEVEGQNGKFVVVDEEEFGLELEDLLRASAYVVGKSRSGIVYKVVVGGGKGSGVVPPTVVAVRRLSEADDATWRLRDFEAEAEAIGKVHHPNIVRLRAYYYAQDEKLLVSDFIRNGSLYSALHGGPSNDMPPLSWAFRLKIAQGTARGLMHIHECSPRKYVHGNLKSSKILLDDDFHPYISGFGLNRLQCGRLKSTNPPSRRPSLSNSFLTGSKILSTPSVAYSAPEVQTGSVKLTQKCDVYSFGIVLMEILTGQLPNTGPDNDGKGLESLVRKVFQEERPLSEIIDPALLHEVYAKKQVLATFHIALNCTELDPELRPRMRTVSESLDGLKFE